MTRESIQSEVGRLNRLFKLYSFAQRSAAVKPYRKARIRQYLEDRLSFVTREYEILKLDVNNFVEHFSPLPEEFTAVLLARDEAIKSGRYEDLPQIMGCAEKLMRAQLLTLGIAPGVHFFHRDRKIFRV